jgi:DNA-directed RNA polymerase II subunit RPB2
MLAEHKTMEVPRHVLRALFRDTKFPLIQHHLDSYNDFLEKQIPTLIQVSNPHELILPGRDGEEPRFIRVYIGGRDGTKIRYTPPTEYDGLAVMPHTCRLDNRTYALELRADVEIEYTFADKTTVVKDFNNVLVGEIPLMLRSNTCYLSGLDGYKVGECNFELGGYFIIDGAEKVLLTQELLGDNMFYAGSRTRRAQKDMRKSLIEQEQPIGALDTAEENEGVRREEITESYAAIKTISEDGSRGPYYQFLVLPSPTVEPDVSLKYMTGNVGRDNRLVLVQIPGFRQPVPVFSVFRALGCSSDKDIYDTILAGVPDKDRLAYDETFRQIILSHDKYLRVQNMTDLDVLQMFTGSKSVSEVLTNIHTQLFSNVEIEDPDDIGSIMRRKSYMLGHMLKMAMDVDLGRQNPSDRDSMQFKRLKTSGVLMFEEFRRIFRENSKEMLGRMDRRVQFEQRNFEGTNLQKLVDDTNVARFWRKWFMLAEFSKSFKGLWGKRPGVSQELARTSYIGTIHNLRKTDLQIDKSTSTAPPRRLTGSQFGIMCPIDSPDGSDLGYKKALTILAKVTTAFPSRRIKEILRETGLVRFTKDIHPSTWKPGFTKIFLNSDIIGICSGDTEELHANLVGARRSNVIPKSVSLAWDRVGNQYTIYSDAGRPIRPVYQEGVSADTIASTGNWGEIERFLDYIDASESDTTRLSMTPHHPRLRSEIHMSFCLSAIANLVPYPDHNPGTRSVFSIAQQKSASSWYHTNFMKRFDNSFTILVSPQKPISQTWLYNEMMGNGGCLGYGENAIMAITVYGGNNQEDSVVMNGGSLKRGSFNTIYFHTYDHTEEMIDFAAKIHTEVANPLLNETVKRKEGFDYSKLDADGIIKVDTIVNDKTILVGMLSPQFGTGGHLKGYRDASVEPKRGQIGRVDAVYRYSTKDGLKGVKVRIAEERVPTIGDKMATRHSQKGTVGIIMPEEDMPYTAKGLKPDIIFNPHGIPTRMTVGQFLEAASNKLGIQMGAFVDATPFTTSNRVQDLRDAMLARGFEPYGSEVLYNGMTGQQMEVDIFMGPIYYQRLKQMVEDKINYRNTGRVKLLTHQPTQGRSDEGGMRIGEMERDSLIAHGMAKFIEESYMHRSDGTEFQFNRERGTIDTSPESVKMPYSMGLFSQELECMHVRVNMQAE